MPPASSPSRQDIAITRELRKLHPDLQVEWLAQDPVTRLLEAQIAFLRKDYAATREITTPLLQLAPNNAMLLQLAGAAEFHLRNLPQAENLLAQAVKIAPGMPLARQLLAQTYLRTGLPEKALETLAPMIDGPQPRAELLTLAGEAHLQTGDAKRAEEMFSRATKVNPEQPRARTALALGQIGKGDAAGGLAALESVSAADPGATADLALVASHLRRGDVDKALKAIDSLERKPLRQLIGRRRPPMRFRPMSPRERSRRSLPPGRARREIRLQALPRTRREASRPRHWRRLLRPNLLRRHRRARMRLRWDS